MFAQETTAYSGNVAVPVIMAYTQTDPYAVTFTFVTSEQEVEWAFARSLLEDVFGHGDSGEGDVRLSLLGTSLRLELRNNSEPFSLMFVAEEVRQFLNHTRTLVPFGAETEIIDVEAEWAEWRDGEAV